MYKRQVLLDAGCGGGLLAPHVSALGYRHVGVDLRASGLALAAERGVAPIAGDVAALPLADESADVVVAGEILEHVTDLSGTVAELCRVLRPGGRVVLDTVNDTALSRLITVTLGEWAGVAPVGLHDPALFVSPARLRAEFALHGVRLAVRGVRPSLTGLVRWLALRRTPGEGALGRVVPTFSTAVLYQGTGLKAVVGASALSGSSASASSAPVASSSASSAPTSSRDASSVPSSSPPTSSPSVHAAVPAADGRR